MQTEKPKSVTGNLVRWFVPLAALLVLAGFLFITPPGLLGKADGIGYAVCHRIDQRSFHIGDRQLPLCARCTGEFNAAGVALIFMGFVSRKRSSMPPKGILAVLAASTFGIYELLRLILRCRSPATHRAWNAVMAMAARWKACART